MASELHKRLVIPHVCIRACLSVHVCMHACDKVNELPGWMLIKVELEESLRQEWGGCCFLYLDVFYNVTFCSFRIVEELLS